MSAGERVDRFIRAARTYGLGEQAARVFAMDALIDYAAEQTKPLADALYAVALAAVVPIELAAQVEAALRAAGRLP